MKIRDDNNLIPPISVVTKRTKCAPSLQIYCEEGGMFAQGGGGGGWSAENSLFWEASAGLENDLYGLKGSGGPVDGAYRVRVLKLGNGKAELDQVALGAIDHDPSVAAIAGADGVYLGTPAAVQAVIDGAGSDVNSLVSGTSDKSHSGTAGSSLTVTLGASPSSKTALVVESARNSVDTLGILVQALGADANWNTLAHIHPRRTLDAFAVAADGNTVLRLVFLGDHEIRSLRRLDMIGKESPQTLELSSATHSRLGDAKSAVMSSGGSSTNLVAGDALEFAFNASPTVLGKVRHLFLQAKGSHTTKTSSRAVDRVAMNPPRHAFVLGAAHPNPSSGALNINFTMADDGPASIRVYDVAGRLMRTLFDGPTTAGPHELVWNATDDRGRSWQRGCTSTE